MSSTERGKEWVTLSNGVLMPLCGLGTYKMNESELEVAIPAALDCGCRLFDTAANYKNEKFLGDILARELAQRYLHRSDVFITTKLRPADMGYDKTMAAIKTSAERLGGYIDLYLIHWPGAAKIPPSDDRNRLRRMESWCAMQDMCASDPASPLPKPTSTSTSTKLLRAIGVSNFVLRHLTDMLTDLSCRTSPHVNQIEIHPAWYPSELLPFCREHNIHLQAYGSLGCGRLLQQDFLDRFPGIINIAKKMLRLKSVDIVITAGTDTSKQGSDTSVDVDIDVAKVEIEEVSVVPVPGTSTVTPIPLTESISIPTPMTISDSDDMLSVISGIYLRWAVQKGFSVIPKSKTPERITQNVTAALARDLVTFNHNDTVKNFLSSEEKHEYSHPHCNGNINSNSKSKSNITYELSREEMEYLDSIRETYCEKVCWDGSVVS